jgi:hypothetical protein
MLRARALGVALLIASVGFGGGICLAIVFASWNDVSDLAEKAAMDAFGRLSKLFGGAITSASAKGVLWPVGIGITGVVVAGGGWWFWWRLPKWQMRSVTTGDPKARADIEDNFRKTVGQALGGIAVLLGAAAAYLQFTQQQNAAHDLLISNQVAKGFEQLGSDKLTIRLGGIYALEGVMNTSPQYHQPVLEALCAFVREGTIGMVINGAPASDIQAALTVVGRRNNGPGFVNLAQAKIAKADLSGADLSDAALFRATLFNADLSGAVLFSSASTDGSWCERSKSLNCLPAWPAREIAASISRSACFTASAFAEIWTFTDTLLPFWPRSHEPREANDGRQQNPDGHQSAAGRRASRANRISSPAALLSPLSARMTRARNSRRSVAFDNG